MSSGLHSAVALLSAVMALSAAAAPLDPSAVAEPLAQQTNAFRASNGLAPLKVEPALAQAAQRFAEYMARTDQYGHEADGRKPADRVREQGYDYCMLAENIAYQASSSGFRADELAQALFAGWVQSPPHRHNLLLPQVTDVGIGVAQSARSGRYYGVEVFGRPRSAATRFVLVNGADSPVRYQLDEQSYDLPPHVVRTHAGCFTGTLQVAGTAAPDAGIAPRDGARYTVRRDASGQLRVEASSP